MIQIKNINKTYSTGENEVKALQDVNINFRNNEFVSILGPSGCGKTTLLNIIGGLDKYTSGDIIINGTSTKDYKDKDWDRYRNHYIGFVFQSYNLISHLSIVENVELALSIAGISKKEKRKRAVQALKEVGLEKQLKKLPRQLSGGQMQRVAIARAIVNQPKIILADEPTGALDSETSVQIMNILKQISKKYLIIMVTHNQELAQEYSTRIINILDGKLLSDTNQYNPSQEEIQKDKLEYEQSLQENLENNDNKKNKKSKKCMSLLTAFALSFKNLWQKKGKTIIESLAGSIGIIGIALVLAVSTGMTNFINQTQSNALGGYPITVSSISVDMEKFTTAPAENNNNQNTEEDVVIPYDPKDQLRVFGHYNNLSKDFINHVKEFENQDKENNTQLLNMVDYTYYTPVKMIVKNQTGNYTYVARTNSISMLSGSASSNLYPMVSNTDFILEQYDLIYGDLPTKQDNQDYSNQLILVIGEGNKLSIDLLTSLGIDVQMNQQHQYENISFKDLCEKTEFRPLYNNDYYIPDSTNYDQITKFDKLDVTDQNVLSSTYANLSQTFKISGILRLKENASSEILPAGLCYPSEFETYYAENCRNSTIAKKQLDNKQSLTFYDNFVISASEAMLKDFIPTTGFPSVQAINYFLNGLFGYQLSNEDAFELGIQQIGISSIPISVKLYPKNFDAKDKILEMINDYNSKVTQNHNKIVYSDTTGFLTSTLGAIINIVSYILIAFAGISLVVSSIMIGIITYSSIVERTKEIGILRSIGARKKDISRIFNCETVTIGLLAGVLGVVISFILTFPISSIIGSLAGGTVGNLAVLKFSDAFILVVISTLLTSIAGTIPAKMASKKDPVICLRSE